MHPPDTENTMNEKMLSFLASHVPRAWRLGEFSGTANENLALRFNKEPYLVWSFLQSALPLDCRCLVYARCALVSPVGVVLAVVLGTSYVLRVPFSIAETLLQLPKMRWYIGVMEKAGSAAPHEQFGQGWVWGMAQKDEPQWCRAVYDAVEVPTAGQ